jgi:hypothetical protein
VDAQLGRGHLEPILVPAGDNEVARSPATDGSRSVLVTMTPAGHELIESTVDRVLSREAALVEGLDAGQRAALAAELDQLLAGIADRLAQPDPPSLADR